MIVGAVDGGATGDLQAVEVLIDTESGADRGVDGIARQPRLHVRAAGIVGRDQQAALPQQARVAGDVEASIDVAYEKGTIHIDRRGQRRAVGVRPQAVSVAGEGAAEVGDHGVAFPVGDGEEFRRDHVERRALRHGEAAGVGVIAGRKFDCALDQETAGVIADRTERVVVDPQALADGLADHGACHRRRQRCPVGGVRGRRRDAHAPADNRRNQRRRRAAGADRGLGLRLSRIIFRLLAFAVQRVVAGIGSAARSR
ncbi:hypothetical protein ES703_100916 [subsurface metagenome]